jgi:prepilin-type processing-associated H-X9-DG protein
MLVIGVAVAVLLKGIESARESARWANCNNHEKQLTLALLNFEAAHKKFPGFKQELAGRDVSWVVMLLPHLDRLDLWKTWEKGEPQKKPLEVMFCPSDPPPSPGPGDGPCAYAVNTKICMDGKGLSLNYVGNHDGTATTLLLGENLRADRAHEWWDTDPGRVGFTVGRMVENVRSNHPRGANVGFCDGHVPVLRGDIGDDLYNALVTPDGGEKVDESEL